jgi:hypothetical protein
MFARDTFNWATIALQNILNILKKIHLKYYKNIEFGNT